MARRLTQRIALEGGDEVRRALEALGDAGRRAFQQFQGAQQANAAIARLSPTLKTAQERADALTAAATRFGNALGVFARSVGTATAGVTALYAALTVNISGLALFVKGAADAADSLQDTAESVGLTARQFNNLRFAFEQSGVSAQGFESAMGRFARSIDAVQKAELRFSQQQRALARDLALGRINSRQYSERIADLRFELSQTTDAFARLGVQIERDNNGNVDQYRTLLSVADGFQRLEDGTTRTALAQELFGRSSQRMVLALSQGSAGLTRLTKDAERVAPVFNQLSLTVADQFTSSFTRLQRAAESAGNSFRLLFAPGIIQVMDALTEAIARNRAAFIEFGAAIADRVRPYLEDLAAIIEGRDADVKNTIMLQWRDATIELGRAVQSVFTGIVLPTLQTVLSVVRVLTTAFNGLFGTDFTAQQVAVTAGLLRMAGVLTALRAALSVVISAVGLLTAAFGALPVALGAVAIAVGIFLANLVQQFGGFQSLWDSLWSGLASIATRALNGVVAAGQVVVAGLVAVWQAGVETLSAILANLRDGFAANDAAVLASAAATWSTLEQMAQAVSDAIANAFQGAADAITSAFQAAADLVLGVLDSIVSAARRVASAIRSIVGGAEGGGFADGGAVGFSRGGRVRGPGTSTSDSIPAWLSRGEFVQRAKAVQKYGVAFMDALNRGVIPVAAVRGLMRGFNAGGLVEGLQLSMPPLRLADGGLVGAGAGGGSPVVLNIGGESFQMAAEGDVVNRLQRFAAKRSLASAGRKPLWYGR